jgi:hypothetical protein
VCEEGSPFLLFLPLWALTGEEGVKARLLDREYKEERQEKKE